MTFQRIEELTVAFDPSELEEKTRRWRRRMRSRLASLVITVVLLAVLYLWKRDQFAGGGVIVLYAVLLTVSVGWFVGYLVVYLRAKRELARAGQGIAVRIGRPGVEVSGTFVPWSEVTSLRAVTERWGRRPRLQLSRTGGQPLSVPLNQLNIRPATLDLTARAYSAGRHGVDLSALDS